MSREVHWFFHICSIVVIGCMVLGVNRQEVEVTEAESQVVEQVESLWTPDTIPVWESNWKYTDTHSGPNAKRNSHTDDCEYFFNDPKGSYEIYVGLDSIGTREQHDEFFKSHCVGEYK